jgi:hypothetical protein
MRLTCKARLPSSELRIIMDARVKPAHDAEFVCGKAETYTTTVNRFAARVMPV